MNTHVVRSGTVTIKDEGFTSFLWRPKWLVLKEHSLLIHKSEVSLVFHPGILPPITIFSLTAQPHFHPL